MLSKQQLRGPVHRRIVQSRRRPRNKLARNGRGAFGFEQNVLVATTRRAVARMKVGRHGNGPPNAQLTRQQAVRTACPRAERTLGGRCETNYLLRRMHAGVGPARSDQRDGCIGNPGERFFQDLLDGPLSNLALPSVKKAAVIFDTKREVLDDWRQFVAPRPTQSPQLGE